LLLHAAALCITMQAYSLSSSPNPRPQTLTYTHTAIRSLGLPFNGLHPRNVVTWISTHLPTPEGWKAELA